MAFSYSTLNFKMETEQFGATTLKFMAIIDEVSWHGEGDVDVEFIQTAVIERIYPEIVPFYFRHYEYVAIGNEAIRNLGKEIKFSTLKEFITQTFNTFVHQTDNRYHAVRFIKLAMEANDYFRWIALTPNQNIVPDVRNNRKFRTFGK